MIATHSFTAGAVDTAATEPPSQDDETADQGWKPDPGSATCKATLTDAQVMTITFDELTRMPCCRASRKQVNASPWLQLQELLPCTIAYRRPRRKTLVCNLKRIGVKKSKKPCTTIGSKPLPPGRRLFCDQHLHTAGCQQSSYIHLATSVIRPRLTAPVFHIYTCANGRHCAAELRSAATA